MKKPSYEVGLKAAQTLYYAERQALRINRELTVSITINWSLLAVDPREATTCFGRLRSQRFAPWVRRPPRSERHVPVEPTYTYGFENSRDGVPYLDPEGPHNVHVHWVVHVPQKRLNDFEYYMRSWLDEVAETTEWPESALKIQRITRAGGAADYPIKGASPAVAKHYGKADAQAYQGIIFGRRTGTTRNLGPTQRRLLDGKLGITRKRMPKPR